MNQMSSVEAVDLWSPKKSQGDSTRPALDLKRHKVRDRVVVSGLLVMMKVNIPAVMASRIFTQVGIYRCYNI